MDTMPVADNTASSKTRRGSAGSELDRFSSRMMEKRHLMPILEKLIACEPLYKAEVQFLCNGTDIPGLLKLVEVASRVHGWHQEARVRPVHFLPVSKLIIEDGIAAAHSALERQIETLFQQDRPPLQDEEALYFIIDSWLAGEVIEPVLEVISNLPSVAGKGNPLIVLGPSSREVLELTHPSKAPEHEQVVEILKLLKDAGISTLHGGSDIRVHELAAERGFYVSVGQVVHPEHSGVDQQYSQFSANFVEQLIWLQHRLQQEPTFHIWFPWCDQLLDSGRPREANPLGAQMLRAIGVARLVLPNLKWIRAPLSMLGLNVAHVALAFGANDLGFAAIDAGTANELGLRKRGEFLATIESHDVVRMRGQK